jgi:predicted membrane protein
MRTLLKALLTLAVASFLTRAAALLITRRFEEGSEVSDEFRRVICLDGVDFISRAGGLRHAEVSVILGGAKVDLRDAVIDPGGATVLLENTMGGLLLLVREDWAVHVDDMLVGGGETEVRVTAPDELPDDAPRLDVQAITRLGGTVIRSGTGTGSG